jgi:hypothetical protein
MTARHRQRDTGFVKLAPRYRSRLQRLKKQNATLREITEMLGYDRGTNWSIVRRALNPDHSFQPAVVRELQERIDRLEGAS